MVYSASLAERVRLVLRGRRNIVEKKLFGGVGFLLHGNMLVGIWKQSLVARLGPVQATAALSQPHVGEFDVTGKPMRGWVLIEPDGVESEQSLAAWIEQATEFVSALPKK